eukprot:tig00020560_g11079.t1
MCSFRAHFSDGLLFGKGLRTVAGQAKECEFRERTSAVGKESLAAFSRGSELLLPASFAAQDDGSSIAVSYFAVSWAGLFAIKEKRLGFACYVTSAHSSLAGRRVVFAKPSENTNFFAKVSIEQIALRGWKAVAIACVSAAP